MRACIDYTLPGEAFWSEYSELWKTSLYKPVFQSPNFIRVLAEKEKDSLAVYKFYVNEKLAAAAFFKETKGVYYFLSDIKTDQNHFIISNACTLQEVMFFFKTFLEEVKSGNKAFILRRMPAKASYLNVLMKAGQASSLFWETSLCSICPAVNETSPQNLYARFDKPKIRWRTNKLIKQEGAVFETFTDDRDLEAWVKAYCKTHIKRWENTSTPSVYLDPERQFLLYNCLKGWIQDGVLVRFSIKTGEERIAFQVAVLQGNELISHSQTFDPAYSPLGPGKSLFRFIAGWMQANGLSTLDFGRGMEEYKYEFVNEERPQVRIFVSGSPNIPFMLSAWKEKTVKAVGRKSPQLRRFYHTKVLPLTFHLKKVLSFW